MVAEEEIARWQHVIPIMDELLQAKGMVEAAAGSRRRPGTPGGRRASDPAPW